MYRISSCMLVLPTNSCNCQQLISPCVSLSLAHSLPLQTLKCCMQPRGSGRQTLELQKTRLWERTPGIITNDDYLHQEDKWDSIHPPRTGVVSCKKSSRWSSCTGQAEHYRHNEYTCLPSSSGHEAKCHSIRSLYNSSPSWLWVLHHLKSYQREVSIQFINSAYKLSHFLKATTIRAPSELRRQSTT